MQNDFISVINKESSNMIKRELIIRPMKEEYLEKVAVLYTEIYAKVDIGEKWTKETSCHLLKYLLLKQPDLCFVALIDNKIVGGFVAGIKPWWGGNHLIDGEVFVDYQYHKNKIGTKLSKAIYKTALDKYKITSIDLVTFSKNGFPLTWYEKLGFKVEKKLIMINGDPKIVMKKLGK
ncbi:MAG: GNAT family N-acetyltransferase [Patescibacteria group bacterium]